MEDCQDQSHVLNRQVHFMRFSPELEPGLSDIESNGNFPADFPVRRIGLFVCLYSADLYISLPYILMLMKEIGTGMERHDTNRWAWKRRAPFIYFFF